MNCKKIISLLLCAVCITISGCGGKTESAAKDKITVHLVAPRNNYIEDFDSNLYKLWLEEQTGLSLRIKWLPKEDAEKIVKTQLASGEGLPDAYVGFGSMDIFNSTALEEYGREGSLLALDEYINLYGTNLNQLFEELPEYHLKELMASADGKIYFMPGFSSSLITRYRQVMWVNKSWMDNLKLEVPETTEEFRQMLLAFKNNDPNKNGVADEIPLAGTESNYAKQVYDFLFNGFIYNNEKNSRLLLENGSIGFAPVEDEWRDALKYMRGLYDEGLISPLSFTQDDQQLRQMANDTRNILGAFPSPGITMTIMQNEPDILQRYIGIGPLKGPDGVQYASVSIPLPKPNGVITSACKHPEEVFRLFDLMLSEQASLRGRYGVQGEDWDFAQKGDRSIFGTPATIRIINQIWNTPQNKHLMQIVPYASRPNYSGGVTWNGDAADGEYKNAQTVLLYRDYEPKEMVGELIFTPEEEAEIKEIRAEIDAHVRKTTIEYICGTKDIHSDEEWQQTKHEFEQKGLPVFIKAAQRAYDGGRASVIELP